MLFPSQAGSSFPLGTWTPQRGRRFWVQWLSWFWEADQRSSSNFLKQTLLPSLPPCLVFLHKGRMKSQDVTVHTQRAALRVVLHHSTDTATEYMATSDSSICKVSQVTGVCAGATGAGLWPLAPALSPQGTASLNWQCWGPPGKTPEDICVSSAKYLAPKAGWKCVL